MNILGFVIGLIFGEIGGILTMAVISVGKDEANHNLKGEQHDKD